MSIKNPNLIKAAITVRQYNRELADVLINLEKADKRLRSGNRLSRGNTHLAYLTHYTTCYTEIIPFAAQKGFHNIVRSDLEILGARQLSMADVLQKFNNLINWEVMCENS